MTIMTKSPITSSEDISPPWVKPWLKSSLDELKAVNARYGWSFNEAELKAIAHYFKSDKREPNRAEIESIAQTWSEHCKHKTFTSPVRYQEGKTKKFYKNLFADTIVAATKKVKKPWCLSVFTDNAGVIQFDKKWAPAYKVETTNPPFPIQPARGPANGGRGPRGGGDPHLQLAEHAGGRAAGRPYRAGQGVAGDDAAGEAVALPAGR